MDEDTITTTTTLPSWVIPAAVGAGSFIAGAVGGYFLGKRHGTTIVENVVNEYKTEVTEYNTLSDDNDVIGPFEPIGRSTFRQTPEGLVGEHVLDPDVVITNEGDSITVRRAQAPGALDHVKEAENRIAREGVNSKTQYSKIKTLVSEAVEAVKDKAEEATRAAVDAVTQEAAIQAEVPERYNVFQQGEDNWDYDSELSSRSKSEPYVIHKDEWDQDEYGYEQSTLTYYALDDVLADSHEVKIGGNWKALVGELKFGHGSNDPTVVYIRNEQLAIEYEVLLARQSYEQEVGGIIYDAGADTEQLAHSHRVLRMRRGD